MAALIKPARTVLPLTASFDAAVAMFQQYPVKYIYIVDDGKRLLGVVALQDITAALLAPAAHDEATLARLLRRDFLHLVTPDMSLDQALQHFLQHQGERLPIVRTLADPELLGAIDKTSLLDAYARLIRSGLTEQVPAAGVR